MAGPIAELVFDPDTYDPAMAGGDYGQIMTILQIFEPNRARRSLLFAKIQKSARSFVDRNSRPIGEVAKRLEQSRTLMEDEIDVLIGGIRQEAA